MHSIVCLRSAERPRDERLTRIVVPEPSSELSVEGKAGCAFEDGVGGEEGCPDVDRGRSNPEVVGVDRFMQGMADLSAGVAELRDGGQQSVADGHDRGHFDRLLQPWRGQAMPSKDSTSPVAKLLVLT